MIGVGTEGGKVAGSVRPAAWLHFGQAEGDGLRHRYAYRRSQRRSARGQLGHNGGAEQAGLNDFQWTPVLAGVVQPGVGPLNTSGH